MATKRQEIYHAGPDIPGQGITTSEIERLKDFQ